MEHLNGNTPARSPDLTLEQVHKRILTLIEKGHRNGHQIGRLYNYVIDSELAQKGGFKDAQDFFKQRVKVVSQAVLSLNGAVARSFTEDVAVKYGMRNLYTLLAYAKLEGLTVEQSDPGDLPIAVPQKDGVVQSKPFADCSVEDLQSAMRHKRAPPQSLPEADAARVQHYRDNLQRHFTDRLSIRVDARNHLGELFITLRDIPEKEMKRLAAALVDEPTHALIAPEARGAERNDAPTPAAPTAAPAQDMAHNDNIAVPASPAAQLQGAGNDAPHIPNVPAAKEYPAVVAPVVKAQGPEERGPSTPVPVAPSQGGPSNKTQGLGGLFRRMTGG
ncbi:hypothetical protein [Pyxidicoccus caerfyrddinensis]|uniref:hypothetical protein n=1 Tax=Pyxidicoccus caerfyrddinensis TaxID=2709663 RepID=UPI0013D9A84F|nr:hypothetical protein [Pyxidicoccus caerfyrddinensis]